MSSGIEYRGEAQYRVRIKRGQVTEARTFETLEAAKAWREQVIGKISGDEYVDKSRERRTTFADLLDRYLEEVTPTKRSAAKERYLIMAWRRELFAALPVISIESSEFTAWRNRRVAEGKASSTISNMLNLASAIFRTAKAEWGYKIDNPLIGIRRPQAEPPREAHLRPEMDAKLIEACREGPPWLPYIVTVALWTAMRQGEIRKLRWEWIDLNSGVIVIPHRLAGEAGRPSKQKITKTGHGRSIPLLDQVVSCLRKWSSGVSHVSGLVFPDARGHELQQDTVSKAYSKAAERAGRSDLTFHDLRHVATTRLAPLHRDAVHLSKTTGHRDPRSLARYYNPDPIDNALEIRAKAKAAGY